MPDWFPHLSPMHALYSMRAHTVSLAASIFKIYQEYDCVSPPMVATPLIKTLQWLPLPLTVKAKSS